MDYLSFVLYLIMVFVAIYLLNSVAKKSNESSPKKLPPGPPGLPIFGNLFSLGTNPHITMSELAKKYGPLMSLQLGQMQTIIISSPALAKEVLQTNDLSFCNRPVMEAFNFDNHMEKSMGMMPVGPRFRMLRKLCNTHIFSTSRLDASQNLRRDKVKDLLSYVQKSSEAGQAVEIVQAAFTTALNLLSSTFFSMDLGDSSSEVAHEMRAAIRGLLVELGKPNIADFFPIFKKMDLQGIRQRLKNHMSKLMDLMNHMIEQRLQGKMPSGLTESNDVLDELLNQEVDEELGTAYIASLFRDLIIGGTDTTSSTFEWVMAELLHNPEKLKKAQAEVRKIISKGNTVQESDIEYLPYLQAVIKETLRLHTPGPLLVPRKAESEVNLLGFTIPKNARVLVNVWAIARDPNIWHNPETFEPERFLSSDIDMKGHHFELLPFGSGRRTCPGMPLGTRMLHLMLASLIHRFDWKLEGNIKPENMNMEERFGIALTKAQPLRAIPIRF